MWEVSIKITKLCDLVGYRIFFFNAMSSICESQVKDHKQTKDDPKDFLKIQ